MPTAMAYATNLKCWLPMKWHATTTTATDAGDCEYAEDTTATATALRT